VAVLQREVLWMLVLGHMLEAFEYVLLQLIEAINIGRKLYFFLFL